MDNKDKQALIDGTATIPYKLHILNDDGSIKDTLTEEDIVSTDYEDYRYVDSSSLCIGQFVARKLKGEIKTIDKDLQIEDKEISVEMGVNRNDGSKVYDITIDGKSEQETTNGTNLIGLDNNQYKVDLKIGDKICVTNNGTTQLNLNLYTNYGDTARNDYFTIYANSKRIVSISKDAKAIAWGGTIEGLVWVNKGEEQLPYEEYTGGQPSPSPDYPQEIKSVEGIENLFTLGKEDTTATGTNVTFNDSEIIINGTTSNSGDLLQKRDDVNQIGFRLIGTLKAGTYTFSSILKSGNFTVPSGKAFAVYIRKADRTIIYSTTSNFNSTKNFTLTEETTLYLQIYCNSANTVFNNCIVDFQIEEGSVSHDYVPYGSWLKVKNTGKNLFDKDNVNYIKGYITAEGAVWVDKNDNINKTFYISIKPNTTYTISKKAEKRFRVTTFSSIPTETTQGNVSYNNNTGSNCTITTGNNDNYLFVFYYSLNDYTLTEQEILDSIMIEEGSTTTEYEPYKEQSTLMDMNKYDENGNIIDYYELCSISDTKDELNIDKDGNVSITQNIGEVVLNGSESWNLNTSASTTNGYYEFQTLLKNKPTQQVPLLCDRFPVGTSYNNSKEQVRNRTDNLIYINILGTRLTTTNSAGFKTWLSTHPVTVKYILDKPQTISLGKYDKIENIDDTENITIQTNIDTTFTKISYNLINWYNLGNFLITRPTDDDVKDTLTFDSMDYTKKFNKSFDSSGITFPCTALQLAKYCCDECGVELATNEFLNYDFEIIDNQYTNEDTFRNVMQDIGKLAYSWVRIGWDNKCYIDFNYGEEVDEYNKIDNDNYYDLDLQQKQFGPVNRIVIGMSNVEGENVYIEDEKSIVEHGVTELQIYDNNLTYTPELRNKVIDSAKVLFGLTYTPMTLNTTGHPWLLGKEKVEVTGMNNTIYYTYPWDRTISYSGHIKSKLESKCDTKTEIEYKYKGDVESVLKKTRIIVNKQENTITSLTQQTTSIQNDLQQNYYDITQTNQLIQTSSTGITNTFSEAGGNNIFRNTGLWFQETEENKWEYWTGTAKKTTNDKAVLGTSILLQSGQFAQEQEVPNGNYSISFYYKLLNPLAKATVKINDNTYELTSTDYKQFYTGEQDENKQYITFPIEVTATHLNISFKTDIDNSVEVYDLMANKGTVKLAYSQNENEVTTDTVNISKGITITSSTKDTKFKADSDGIRILNKTSDEKITEFTDKGMTTKEAIVEEEATIVQVLIQNIGDQTWFTRL